MADLLSGRTLVLQGIEDLHPVVRGGSATLYRGRQPTFHRDVAVKILDAGVEGTGPGSFLKELRALGSLSGHPHVVPLYDAGEIDGHPYLIMPFLSGGSLADRLKGGPLPAGDVRRIGVAVADALEAAHASGILHRDLKPANVLFNSYGEPQLADFGIAHFVDSTKTYGLLAATVGYAAPEVLVGEDASPAADVYSLGATLHAALGGSPPFEPHPDEAPIAFAARVVRSEVPPLSSAPPAIAAVVARAMEKDPARRYPTAAALKEALSGIDPPPSTAPVPGRASLTPSGEPAKTGGHGRRRAAVVAGVLLLGTGGAVAALAGTGGNDARNATGRTPPSNPAPTRPSPTRPSATFPSTTVAPVPTTPATTTPATTVAAAGTAPSPGSAAQSEAAYVRSYYSLVNSHSLSQSWTWLSRSYQQRLGYPYYEQFWNSVADVQVLDVQPGTDRATVTLRYDMTNGNTQTEKAVLSFVTDPTSGRRLIDNTTAVG